jgi:photosystem II stability/assembly factor-like uncharacterized protein
MNKIKGKQIDDSTILQNNLIVETNTITHNSAVTNLQYLQEIVDDKIGDINFSMLNDNMTALETTGSGQLACNKHIIEYPISNVRVKVNGVEVNVGGKTTPYDCYFSSDSGVTAKTAGEEEKGDYLYWNALNYNLSTDDEIDFYFLVNYKYYDIISGGTITFNTKYDNIVVEYEGDSGTTSTVVIDGVNFTVGNVNGYFVFDIGGSNEHTFTYILEKITIIVNDEEYDILWDGFGSLLFSVEKKKKSPTKRLVLLTDQDFISTQIDDISYYNNDLYILKSIQSEAYTKKLYRFYSNNNTWVNINTPTGYNNEYDHYDMCVNNNNLFCTSFFKLDESDNNVHKIIKSTNNGTSWDVVYTMNTQYNGYMPSVFFTSSNIGYTIFRSNYVGNSFYFGVLKTTDGGDTWNMLNDDSLCGTYFRYTFINDNEIWFRGTYSYYDNGYKTTERLYKTNDGCLTATLLTETSGITNSEYLVFINSNTGYIINRNENALYKTIDGGYTFNKIDINIDSYNYTLRGLKTYNNYIIIPLYEITVDEQSLAFLIISDDDGLTWTKKLISNDLYVDDIVITDNNHITVHGKFQNYFYMPVVFITNNGGDNWTQILNLNNQEYFTQYNSIYFVNSNIGFLIGSNETLLKTEDGGLNWDKYDMGLSANTNYELSEIYFTDVNNGYIVGYYYGDGVYSYNGIILKSYDGGLNWVEMGLPVNNACLEKIYFNGNIGWITGYDGDTNDTILIYSNDNGETWIKNDFTLETSYFMDVLFTDNNNGIISGYEYNNGYGFLYKTNDGGETWVHDDIMSKSGYSFYNLTLCGTNIYLTATDDNNGYCIIYKTVDGGNTWNEISINFVEDNTGYIENIEFYDNKNGILVYAYGSSTVIYTTSDSGNTWNIITSSVVNGVYNAISRNYVVGESVGKTILLFKIL